VKEVAGEEVVGVLEGRTHKERAFYRQPLEDVRELMLNCQHRLSLVLIGNRTSSFATLGEWHLEHKRR